jgi:hypothetical protein
LLSRRESWDPWRLFLSLSKGSGRMNPDEIAGDDVVRYAQYRGVWIYRRRDTFYVVMSTVDGEQTMFATSAWEAENFINAFLDCK